jgi:hypothetical protein
MRQTGRAGASTPPGGLLEAPGTRACEGVRLLWSGCEVPQQPIQGFLIHVIPPLVGKQVISGILIFGVQARMIGQDDRILIS